MKTLVTLFSVLLTSQLLFATSEVTIQVTNPTEREFRISYEQDAVTAKVRIFRINLRDDNSASFELSLPARTELHMRYGNLDIPLFIGPNDKLSINLDGYEGLESISFTGPAADDNNFLAAYAKTFPSGSTDELGGGFLPFAIEKSILAEAAMGDITSYIDYVNAGYNQRNDLINRYSSSVSSELIKRYKDKNTYQAEIKKIAFLLYNQQVMTPTDIRAAAQRLSLLSPNTVKDQKMLKNDDFKDYLRAYAQYLALPNNGAHDERNGDELFKAIRANIDRPWRHYLQSELLVNAFDYLGNPEFGLDRYVEMKRDGVSEVYRNRVESAYGEVLNLAPDALAPNIGMYGDNGMPISLTDLSGKVVYISFWASWCKPCLVNFKKYDSIRSQLEAKGVVLLNVSIDENESDWKRSLATNTPRGKNTRATSIDDVKRAYNLSSIPAYYIIDKHGKIVILPEGENRDLLSSFDEIIQR